jgi:hypothetical protein
VRAWPAIVATLMAAALTGCGIGAPRPSDQARSPVARAQATHEYPSSPPRPEQVSAATVSAVAAIRAFASAYINWDAQTVSAEMQALATRSVGQARSAAQLAAAETAGDYELQRGGIANSGTVEAIAPLPGHPDQYLVVTRERTTATATTAYQGLAPAWHVAIATVAQLAPRAWVVSGWQPQS